MCVCAFGVCLPYMHIHRPRARTHTLTHTFTEDEEDQDLPIGAAAAAAAAAAEEEAEEEEVEDAHETHRHSIHDARASHHAHASGMQGHAASQVKRFEVILKVEG